MFCDSERKIFGLKQENFFCRIAKTTIEEPVGTFSGNFSNIFSSFFIFRQGHQNLHSRCQNDHFEEFVYVFFHNFWSLSRKSGAFSRKPLAMLLNLCFTSPKRYFDEIFFFIEKLFSRTLLDKGQIYTGFLAKTFRQCCQNFILSVHRKFSGNKKFEKKSFFSVILGHGAKKTFGPWRSYFGKVFKTAIYVSKEIFWGDFFLSKKRKFFESFVTMTEKPSAFGKNFFLLLGCQNCNLSFYRNNLCVFFESYPFKFHRWRLSKRTRNHGKNYSARLLILHSTCP